MNAMTQWFKDALRVNTFKKELNGAKEELQSEALKYNQLRKELGDTNTELYNLKKYMETKGQLSNYELAKSYQILSKVNNELKIAVEERRREVVELDEKILLETHGFYQPKYNLANSEQYKKKLVDTQNKQKELIKAETAILCAQSWTVGDSKKDGEKMIKENQKLILRCFNNECDAAIAKVKHATVEAAEKKIGKAYEAMNKFGSVLTISITKDYYNLKLQELYVVYEYELKKQEEKIEAQELREKLKEEAKVAKEIADARQVNDKEKTHFENRLNQLTQRLAVSNLSEPEKALIVAEQQVAQTKLEECQKRDNALDYREQNASAGYVYIISNLGAFGENIFKIGVTRRLDPTDRIDELGSASVPFRFDTHAIIFSENAFQLENALHKAFHHKRVNLVNQRKEFFKLNLSEVNEVLKANFKKHFELKMEPEALDYRESKKLREAKLVSEG